MARRNRKKGRKQKPMIFQPLNYKLLILGLFLIVIGFMAMYMDNSIWGLVPLYLSPIVILAGYVVVIFSIITKTHDTPSAKSKRANG
jgi:polyferredoxin